MMLIHQRINKLKKIALILFLVSSSALIGSVLLHNYLISFKFDYNGNWKLLGLEDVPGSNYILECNQENNFCSSNNFYVKNSIKSNILGECFKNKVQAKILINDTEIDYDEAVFYYDHPKYIFVDKDRTQLKENFRNKKMFYKKTIINAKSESCIKNSRSYKLYKIFPQWYHLIANIRAEGKGLVLASDKVINPFFYGETSIGNLVKRFPVNLIYKPLLFLSVLLMIFYWLNFNYLFKALLKKENNYFFYFGIFSAFFLFLQIMFQGISFENEIFQKLRRLIILLFVLNELFAQISLTRQLYLNSENLINFCDLKIIKIKVLFISSVIIISFIVLVCLIFINFPNRLDFILQWNYFLVLLFYYFLSSIMWKKAF